MIVETTRLRLRAFHPSLFQVAVDHGGAISLVTIRYVFENGQIDTAPAYADEISLPGSMRAIFKYITNRHQADRAAMIHGDLKQRRVKRAQAQAISGRAFRE